MIQRFSIQHEAAHWMLLGLDTDDRFKVRCTCGDELSSTSMPPHHCIGTWRKHVTATASDPSSAIATESREDDQRWRGKP